MYREFFARSPLLALPLASLVLFMVAFAMILYRVIRGDRRHFDAMARLTLEDGKEARP